MGIFQLVGTCLWVLQLLGARLRKLVQQRTVGFLVQLCSALGPVKLVQCTMGLIQLLCTSLPVQLIQCAMGTVIQQRCAVGSILVLFCSRLGSIFVVVCPCVPVQLIKRTILGCIFVQLSRTLGSVQLIQCASMGPI